jgi:hypothetical protein
MDTNIIAAFGFARQAILAFKELDIEEGGKGKEAHCCLRAPPLV